MPKNIKIKDSIEKTTEYKKIKIGQEQIKYEEKSLEKEKTFGVGTIEIKDKERETEKTGEKQLSSIVGMTNAQKVFTERQKRIESILAKGLEEIYLKLDPFRQKEFKIVGEKTAREINNLLEKTKVKIKNIIKIIKKWLIKIPGINKFFLEQEAKIKADEIMKLK